MTKRSSPARFVARSDEERVAEARAFTRARRKAERTTLKCEHNKKMLKAVRSGNKDELKRLMAINPLLKPTKRQTRRRCNGLDIFMGKQVSLTYVSDVAMDNCTNWLGFEAFEGVHRWEVARGSMTIAPAVDYERMKRERRERAAAKRALLSQEAP